MMLFDEIEQVPIESIQPSPENDEIYGAINPKDIDLVNLANDIAANGIREPLLVSDDCFIISGHRRYAAATLVGLPELPIRRSHLSRSEHTKRSWLKVLRSHNLQRVKSDAVKMREVLLDIDPEIAHQQLIAEREKLDRNALPQIVIEGTKTRSEISDRKSEMLHAAIKVINELRDYWPLSVRQVHYGLLNNPPLRNSSGGKQRAVYENNNTSYGDLSNLLARARLKGEIPWEAISDDTRPVTGTYFHRDSSTYFDIKFYHFLSDYRRDLLQSQPDHVELIVEKLTVQSIILPVAHRYCLPMTVGRGYCSLVPRYEIFKRYMQSGKARLKLLVVSDFDPDGEEIAESLAKSMRDDFGIAPIIASKILLRADQVKEWSLPPNIEAKQSSARYKKFFQRYGTKHVFELEAITPQRMQAVISEAIEATIDIEKFNQEVAFEKQDAARLSAMKKRAEEAFSDLLQNDE